MGIVAHVQDIAVARTQKGKKMGLRVLEALVHAATEYGAFKVGFLAVATQELRDRIQALLSHSWFEHRTRDGFSSRHHGSFSAISSDLVGDNQSVSSCPSLHSFSVGVLRTTY